MLDFSLFSEGSLRSNLVFAYSTQSSWVTFNHRGTSVKPLSAIEHLLFYFKTWLLIFCCYSLCNSFTVHRWPNSCNLQWQWRFCVCSQLQVRIFFIGKGNDVMKWIAQWKGCIIKWFLWSHLFTGEKSDHLRLIFKWRSTSESGRAILHLQELKYDRNYFGAVFLFSFGSRPKQLFSENFNSMSYWSPSTT